MGVLIFVPFVFRAVSGRFTSRDRAGDRGRARHMCGRCAQGIVSDLGVRVGKGTMNELVWDFLSSSVCVLDHDTDQRLLQLRCCGEAESCTE